MKLFGMLVGSTLGNSILQNVVMDPNDPNYSQKTAAILRLNGIDVNTDPFFAEDSIEGGNMGVARTQGGSLDLRKLKQLKVLVATKMSQKLKDHAGISGSGFGLYCYYGCHCLTDLDHISEEYGLVGGEPIDDIDRTCKQMGTCYKCTVDKHGKKKDGSNKCQPEKTNYAYTLNNNEITCNGDLNNECQQDVCMCDKAFADNVSEHEDQWKAENHVTRGGFDRHSQCLSANRGIGNSAEFESCCGQIPQVTEKKTNQKCCGSSTFRNLVITHL